MKDHIGWWYYTCWIEVPFSFLVILVLVDSCLFSTRALSLLLFPWICNKVSVEVDVQSTFLRPGCVYLVPIEGERILNTMTTVILRKPCTVTQRWRNWIDNHGDSCILPSVTVSEDVWSFINLAQMSRNFYRDLTTQCCRGKVAEVEMTMSCHPLLLASFLQNKSHTHFFSHVFSYFPIPRYPKNASQMTGDALEPPIWSFLSSKFAISQKHS